MSSAVAATGRCSLIPSLRPLVTRAGLEPTARTLAAMRERGFRTWLVRPFRFYIGPLIVDWFVSEAAAFCYGPINSALRDASEHL